ncbi:MAG: PIN domain-containing protein [Gammaproteobacteria bacterium]|nr:PIN domain-containing protein [Gammaproteobacteria bacterium]MCY4198339.1 PIN domain-containing protein [Gammaproteobacteria bacterium]MCY4277991.1 PIN domain-containing protein [Gammaproteobacteria bacterium]
MRAVFDTNVLVDFFLDREPFAGNATNLIQRAERMEFQGLVCATSVTTVDYLARKAVGLADARDQVAFLLSVLEVVPVYGAPLHAALESSMLDFEDAVIAESSRRANVDYIVTRDTKGFAQSPVPAHTPESFRRMLDLLH